jgi:hypothetical protein
MICCDCFGQKPGYTVNIMVKTKRILGVMGSPRKKGNTHILVSDMLEAAENAGATTEILLLGDKE